MTDHGGPDGPPPNWPPTPPHPTPPHPTPCGSPARLLARLRPTCRGDPRSALQVHKVDCGRALCVDRRQTDLPEDRLVAVERLRAGPDVLAELPERLRVVDDKEAGQPLGPRQRHVHLPARAPWRLGSPPPRAQASESDPGRGGWCWRSRGAAYGVGIAELQCSGSAGWIGMP